MSHRLQGPDSNAVIGKVKCWYGNLFGLRTYRGFGLHYTGWHSISVDASVEIMRLSEKPVSARSERKSASVRSQPPITNISSSIKPEGWAAESATLSMRRRVVGRQNVSRDEKRGAPGRSGPEYDHRLDTARRLWRPGTRGLVELTCIYIKDRKSIRVRPLDRNDGAALLAAPEQGLDPKLRNESCRQASPSQVRDACGPRDGNEHTRRAIASDGVHSAQQCGPAGLVYSFPPTALRCHSAREIGRKFAWE